MGHDDSDDFFGIIPNTKDHKLRKLSSGEIEQDLYEIGLKIKHSFSKFDEFNPFFNVAKQSLNLKSNLKNKFNINPIINKQNFYKGNRSKANSINYNINAANRFIPLNKYYPLNNENSIFYYYHYSRIQIQFRRDYKNIHKLELFEEIRHARKLKRKFHKCSLQ